MNEVIAQGETGIGQIPEGVCPMCMKEAELMMCQVSYPGCWGQRKLCIDCKDVLCVTIMRALASVRW